MFLVVVLACACAGTEGREAPRGAVAATPAPPQQPAAASDAAPTPSDACAAHLGAEVLGPFARLRLGMRPGLGSDERASDPAEAEAAVAAAGGSLGCDHIAWVSDEAGVLDGTCDGSLTLAGQPVTFELTFRRFELPNEDGRPGLLTVTIFGPSLAAPELEPWLSALRGQLEAACGPGRGDEADRRWQLPDRSILLHDPRQAPCGGFCVGSLWMGGRGHPELAARGFSP